MHLVFEDQTFSFELLRTVSYAPYGGADLGECLATASQIRQGEFESWYEHWSKRARRVHALADSALQQGKRVSAREAYLRASNYYRTAEFFLHGKRQDPRILATWRNSRATFRQAVKLMDTLVEEVLIPYEGTQLPGYYYRPDDSHQPYPTLMVHGGYDSTGEELYFLIAAALQRGYACLTFEGPGQGALLRERHLPFRPDWEQVVTPVVDFLLTRPEVDPARIALMGISLGGYLAPRAAAFEHRFAALITDDGLYSYQFSEKAHAVTRIATLFGRAIGHYVLRKVMKRNTGTRWAIENGMFTFQVDSIWDLIEATESWSLEGVANTITCPTLVCEAEGDHFFAGQPKMLYEALSCPKTLLRFTAEDGAEEHCQLGALLLSNHQVLSWLDSTLHVNAQ